VASYRPMHSHCDVIPFYSTLKRKVSALPMNKASPHQWQSTIRNLKKSGIREEEIRWSGMSDWMEAQSGPLKKADVLEHIRFDQLKIRMVKELSKLSPHLDFIECNRLVDRKKNKWANAVVSAEVWYYERTFQYNIVRVRRDSLFGDYDYWMLLGPNGKVILPKKVTHMLASDGWLTAESTMDVANQDVRERYGHLEWFTATRQWRYEGFHGGQNYREWLLTLPHFPESYYSVHFKTRNIVAHVRSDERQDVFGRRILFLQEIQSDWHQNGRLRGYSDTVEDSDIPYGPFADSWHELAIKTMLYIAAKSGVDGISWTTGVQQVERWKHYYANNNTTALMGLHTFYDKIIPKFIRQFSKQFNVTLDETSFETKEQKHYASRIHDGWVLMVDGSNEPMSELFQSRKVVEDLANRQNATTYVKAPILLMTDAMKVYIKQHGVPLFGLYPK